MFFFKVVALCALNFFFDTHAQRINCMQGTSIKTKGLIKIAGTGLISSPCTDEGNVCKRFDLSVEVEVFIIKQEVIAQKGVCVPRGNCSAVTCDMIVKQSGALKLAKLAQAHLSINYCHFYCCSSDNCNKRIATASRGACTVDFKAGLISLNALMIVLVVLLSK